jgi:ribosome-associated heat shock protein Hsp15
LKGGDNTSPALRRRLDQWLWFARFVKSRSLAARLCTAGAVTANGRAVHAASQIVRIGDTIAVPQGPYRRTVRVLELGVRRGPVAEARRLYEESAAPMRLSQTAHSWVSLLGDEE